MGSIDIKELLKKKTLIVGDVATGKTKLTSFIIKEMINEGMKNDITIIDMAPERKGKVGGKIRDFIDVNNLRYYTFKALGPRSNAKDEKTLYRIAEMNRKNIEVFFEVYKKQPTKILVINDLTIYLHAGSLERIFEIINLAETFIGNAYKGSFFENSVFKDFNEKEKEVLKMVEKFMDIVIELY